MRKKIVATLTTLLACLSCVAAGAAPAGAVEYAYHVYVGAGGNYFGPYVYFYAAETYPWGTAIGCAGVRGVGLNCAAKSGEVAIIELPYDVEAEPYIHNHSTWNSYFSGFYYKSAREWWASGPQGRAPTTSSTQQASAFFFSSAVAREPMSLW